MMMLLARTSPMVNTAANDAAKFVMLGVIFVILSGLLAFIFRLRYLSRNPLKEADELEAMVESDADDGKKDSWA